MSSNKNSLNRTRSGWMILVWVIVISLLLGGCAQKPKVYHVGILSGTSDFLPIGEGFRAKMTELGYIEGKNIVYDVQNADADPVALERMAKKFVGDKVDLIFTIATEATVAAKTATQGTNIPIVFAYAGLDGTNLVKSLREPGGNITGVRYPGTDQIVKRLELLIEMAPRVKRVWTGYDTVHPNATPTLAALRPYAVSKGITLVEVPATAMKDFETDLTARAKSADPGVDAMILMPDGFNHSPEGWGYIKKFAAERKVPLAGSFLYTVEQGAVFGNADDFVQMGQLAAPLAVKVLNGTQAGTIPLVTPEQNLYINYRVAQELGLQIPEGLLRQAAQIIR